ncbi:MAG: helicase [Deltaproteobacteria bacterium]|nr:helicase [Deltaproteobacteria bacterium]
MPDNPIIVQSDRSILLETAGPKFEAARNALSRFAELVKSPEYIHTYRLSDLSLWNGASSGLTMAQVVSDLERYAKYPLPPAIPVYIEDMMGRYGRLRLLPGDTEDSLVLEADTPVRMKEVRGSRGVARLLGKRVDARRYRVPVMQRGEIKQALLRVGHPVQDLAGFVDGTALEVSLRSPDRRGRTWDLRRYQTDAVDAFLGGPVIEGPVGVDGGSGVVVLPCGAGKTIVGLSVLAQLGMRTLILCTNTTALRQWRNEILERTTLTEEEVREYSGSRKEVGAVTLSTYQMLTHRKTKGGPFTHFGLFDAENWGLVIYDEVHLLPAPVFRAVASIQARRRLGLTATLVREDGRQGDVFALIGPKRFDVPWRELEHSGWIAEAECVEVRVAMNRAERLEYAGADDRERYRLASTIPEKQNVVEEIMRRHAGERVLVLGMYLDQLRALSDRLGAPLITGETRQADRDRLFAAYRSGAVRTLVISRVGNFSVDLPDASVAIQVSGSWGSRQEEAQRLGRVLRPKEADNRAWFYTVVTRESVEQKFAERRQRFLAEQGYRYTIETRDEKNG